jgi:hydroxyacylglutathione hydrolase
MKRDNRSGPKLLGTLPEPPRIGEAEFKDAIRTEGVWFLDLRSHRGDYMRRHAAGSLHCPLQGVTLSMVAGSFVEEEERIVLLVEREDQVEEAVRQLIRIGLDHIVGWAPVEEALAWAERGGCLRAIARIDGADLPERSNSPGAAILDVRSAAEHAEGAVAGSVNIAYTRLRARQDEIPRGDPLYVHCASGKRAALAASWLESLGSEVVWVDGEPRGAATCPL